VDRHHFWRLGTSGLGILLSHNDPRHDRRLAYGPFWWVGRKYHADRP
jgi:hypothetical protein